MLALVLVLAVLLIAAVVALFVRQRQFDAYRAAYTATPKDVEAARTHSVATSKGTTRGLAAEHLAPFFPEMVEQFSPGDRRFLGNPVDFVVWDGLGQDAVTRLVLVEVKGGADRRLSPRQAALRAAVEAGTLRLEWLTLTLPKPLVPRRRARPRIVELPNERA